MLAQLGYTAFALDMYGSGKVADHPDDAKSFMQAVTSDMSRAEKRFDKAKLILQRQPTVDPRHIAAIGYCFGGGIVLHMARAGDDLDGVVSFHGSLGTEVPAAKGKIKARVLVFTGAADPFAPAEVVAAFDQEMQAAGADYELISYPGVKHSFTNPGADEFAQRFGMPLAYDKHADEDSWQRTANFLAEIFRN
jgi:dienelactone hydrolase